MPYKYSLIVVIICLLHIHTVAQNEGNPLIKNYLPQDYKGAAQNWAIAQDNSGVMYFGNGNSILEYDGVSWRNMPTPNNSICRSLAKGNNGVIYFGGVGIFGYLGTNDLGKKYIVSLSDSLTEEQRQFFDVWRTWILDDDVYYMSFDKLFRYNINTGKLYWWKASTRFFPGFIYRGQYYVQEQKVGLKRVEGDSLMLADTNSVLDKAASYFTAMAGNDSVLIPSTRNGFFVYRPHNKTLQKITTPYDTLFKGKFVYTGSRFDQQNFTLGTISAGAMFFNNNLQPISFINKQTGVANNTTVWITGSDASGNLWIGLDKGLASASVKTPLTYWNESHGLQGTVYDIIRFNGTIYITTSLGVFYIENNEVKRIEYFAPQQCWAFHQYQTADNKPPMLLVAMRDGVFDITDRNNPQRRSSPDLAGAFDIAPSYVHPERLYVGGLSLFCSLVYQNGVLKHETVWEGIKDQVWHIVEEKGRYLWLMTSSNGVIRLTWDNKDNFGTPSGYTATYYKQEKGLPSLNSNRIFVYNDTLLFATEKGLYYYQQEKDTFRLHWFNDLKAGLKPQSPEIILFGSDKSGNILLTGQRPNNNIFWFRHNGKGYQNIPTPFNRMPDMSMLSILFEENGIAWLGGTEGLYRFDSKKTYSYDQPYHALIRKVTINTDSVIYWGGQSDTILSFKKSIDYQYNILSFEFAAPFFDDEQKTQYRFYLQGFDDRWSDWQYVTTKEYTNLHEGKYTFMVQARNVYNQLSKQAAYSFRIMPPWYRTWWAYLLYVVAFIVCIWLLVRYNTRRLQTANDRLERLVRERTAEINQQKEEIQTQAEKLETYSKELEKLSIVASETDNAVIIMDAKGKFLWFNEGFTRLYEFTGEEFTALYPDVFAASNNPDIKQTIQNCIESRKSVIYETQSKTKSGESRWVQTTITPIMDDYDRVEKLIAIDADIKKLKQAEHEIRIKNEQITAGIRYAQTIQQAILPFKQQIDRYFDSFILYRPKDIVSGDFYWFSVIENEHAQYLFAAVVDCTGHGVPGAFMSMIGSRLLKEIVNEQHIYDPSQILEHLDHGIVNALQQEETDNNDGMDISLIRIQYINNQHHVLFAGAKNCMYMYDSANNQLTESKTDRLSIGGRRKRKSPFLTYSYTLNSGDIIYLFSDGIIDQNNLRRKRFGSGLLKQTILDNARLSMQQQYKQLEDALQQWQQDEEQRDDITVIGLKLNPVAEN